LIWFDNTRVYGSPSYYVQQLFSLNRPDVVLPVKLDPAPAAAAPPLYVVAGLDRKTGETILDVVNPSDHEVAAEIGQQGAPRAASGARLTVLTSASANDENTFEAPMKVAPREETLKISGAIFSHSFPANSLTILRIESGN
jgi:alpha-N-arabinofuranosidase